MKNNKKKTCSTSSAPEVSRIGAGRSLTTGQCLEAVLGPFEACMRDCLDLLYCDSRTRSGVRSAEHARLLFGEWLQLCLRYEKGRAEAGEYLTSIVPLYKTRGTAAFTEADQYLSRRQAHAAMHAPLSEVADAFLARLYNPEHEPGIRDVRHARECFQIFCRLYCEQRTRPES